MLEWAATAGLIVEGQTLDFAAAFFMATLQLFALSFREMSPNAAQSLTWDIEIGPRESGCARVISQRTPITISRVRSWGRGVGQKGGAADLFEEAQEARDRPRASLGAFERVRLTSGHRLSVALVFEEPKNHASDPTGER